MDTSPLRGFATFRALITMLMAFSLVIPVSVHASVNPDIKAVPPEVAAALAQPVLQGQQRFRWFTFTIYDIRLWVSELATPQTLFNQPFVLELEYARSLEGKAIAERSLKEMQGLAEVAEGKQTEWLSFMEKAFPDVKAGDRLSGVWQPDGTVRFLFNGQETASISDARFGELFFGIWLAPETSEPGLRAALLGLNP